jgi:hypothetical protein
MLEGDPGPLVTTALVIAEAAYLIDRQLGPEAEAALYSSIIDRSLNVEDLTNRDWGRVRQLVETYSSLRLGGTDASFDSHRRALGCDANRHVEPPTLHGRASGARRRLRAVPVTPPAVVCSATVNPTVEE